MPLTRDESVCHTLPRLFNSDFIPSAETPLAEAPCAKRDVAGSRVVTEGGTLLGQVANVYVHLAPPPLVAYEVRESLLDKLLGRGLFIPAALGRALSRDSQRIIVPEDASRTAAASLEELAGGRARPG